MRADAGRPARSGVGRLHRIGRSGGPAHVKALTADWPDIAVSDSAKAPDAALTDLLTAAISAGPTTPRRSACRLPSCRSRSRAGTRWPWSIQGTAAGAISTARSAMRCRRQVSRSSASIRCAISGRSVSRGDGGRSGEDHRPLYRPLERLEGGAGRLFAADILPATYDLLPQATKDQGQPAVAARLVARQVVPDLGDGLVRPRRAPCDPVDDLKAVNPALVQCFYGKEDDDPAPTSRRRGSETIGTSGGHHFDGDYGRSPRRSPPASTTPQPRRNPEPAPAAAIPSRGCGCGPRDDLALPSACR